MADDFEKAVLISLNYPGNVDPQLKERASVFIQELKQSDDCWRLCIERFPATGYSEVKFWCLQTVYEIIRNQYSSFPVESKNAVKGSLLTWLQRECSQEQGGLQPFLRNKLAQAIVAIVQLEYPSCWPTFFHDLIGAAGQGPGLVDMFCRVLISVDEDIISLEIPRNQEEARLSMHVKDSMRDNSIAEVAQAWYSLTLAYRTSHPELAAFVLQSMSRYISWMDIGLVANDKFIDLLLALIKSSAPVLQAAATDAMIEALAKRMEAPAKLSLVQQLKVVPLCATWSGGLPEGGEDEDVLLKLAKLLCTLATEIMDSLKKVENGVISFTAIGLTVDDDAVQEASAACTLAMQLLAQLFPALLAAFQSDVDEVALPLVPFMMAYVNRLKNVQKRGQALPQEDLLRTGAILKGIAMGARYPADSLNSEDVSGLSQVELQAAREEQQDVEEKRRELFVLFKNIAKLSFENTLAAVGSMLQSTISRADASWQEVEVSVAMLYELGEGAPEEAMKPGSGALAQLVVALMQASIPGQQHRLVALTVLETFVRFVRVLPQHQHVTPKVLATFLDVRGVGHPSPDVSTRACYLLSRLVKFMRSNLRPFINEILQNLQPHLSRVASTPLADDSGSAAPATRDKAQAGASACVDDRLYLFEAVGLLLGQEEVPAEQQAAMLSSLLQILMQQIEANLQPAAAGAQGMAAVAGGGVQAPAAGLILQALEAISRVSKGFKSELVTRSRPQLAQLFTQCQQVATDVPRALPRNKLLRTRYISLTHRMVETLAAAMLPCLPAALEVLMHTQVDASDMCEVLVLLNQLVLRYKEALAELLEQALPLAVQRVHALLPPDWDWSGQWGTAGGPATPAAGASPEDMREKGELQRTYYALLHAVVHTGLAGALLKAPGALDVVMGALVRGAGAHSDVTIRKTCVQVFSRMVSEWCPASGDVVPGFRRFAMEQLGGQACVRGVLQGGLDPRDAATSSLLSEAAAALKLLHEKGGEEFVGLLVGQVLPGLSCPAAVQQQLVFHLRESEAKVLKDYLRALMVQAAGSSGK